MQVCGEERWCSAVVDGLRQDEEEEEMYEVVSMQCCECLRVCE